MLSLRFRVLLGAVLWTVGLVLFSFGLISWVFRTHPDMPFLGRRGEIHFIWASHAGLIFFLAGVAMVVGALQVRRGLAGVTQLRARLVGVRERTRAPAGRSLCSRGAAARRRPECAARSAGSGDTAGSGQSGRSRARPQDAAGAARARSGARLNGRDTTTLPPRSASRSIGCDVRSTITSRMRELRRPDPVPALVHPLPNRPTAWRERCRGSTPTVVSPSTSVSPRPTSSACRARTSTKCLATCLTTPANGRGRT